MKTAEIYIGTSIRGPGKGTGRTMYLMRCQRADGTPYESIPCIAEYDEATESRLVLYSLRDALSRFNYGCEITLYTECRYVAAAITQDWPRKWQENGWKNSKGVPVADEILWSDILQKIEGSGHELTAREGRHEWSEWMRWNMPLASAYKDIFRKVGQKQVYFG